MEVTNSLVELILLVYGYTLRLSHFIFPISVASLVFSGYTLNFVEAPNLDYENVEDETKLLLIAILQRVFNVGIILGVSTICVWSIMAFILLISPKVPEINISKTYATIALLAGSALVYSLYMFPCIGFFRAVRLKAEMGAQAYKLQEKTLKEEDLLVVVSRLSDKDSTSKISTSEIDDED